MRNYLLIVPIALLVTYSQVMMKWRSTATTELATLSFTRQILRLLADPVILSAYAAALIASFAWLYVVTRLPLTVAFPVYIGVTFAMVLFGGVFFLAETLTTAKLIAVLLIACGVILGVRADG